MDSRPRSKVTTCTGYVIHPGESAQAGNARLGLTASVLDRAEIHREVARYRSETPLGNGIRLGREGALRSAQEHADRLNAEYG